MLNFLILYLCYVLKNNSTCPSAFPSCEQQLLSPAYVFVVHFRTPWAKRRLSAQTSRLARGPAQDCVFSCAASQPTFAPDRNLIVFQSERNTVAAS